MQIRLTVPFRLHRTIISNENHVDAYEKMHLAFLQAFVRGIGAYNDQLGETIESDLTTFLDLLPMKNSHVLLSGLKCIMTVN